MATCASLVTQRASKIRIRSDSGARIAAEPTDDTFGVAVMQSSSPEQQAGQDSRSARRRLIRGAFGAPAALTLYSGSVSAASLTCVARRVAAPVNPGTTASATGDIYVRVQVRSKRSGENRSRWVYGGDVLIAASLTTAQSGVSFLGSDNWYCLSAGSNGSNQSGYTPGLVYTNAQATSGGTPGLLANTFVALRFNASGQIVGVTDTAGASAVSRSCWTSFARTI